MAPSNPIRRFAVRLALFYGLLVIPWPGVRDGYAVLFRAGGNALFGSFGSEGVVAFRAPDTKHAAWDTDVKFRRRGDRSGWKLELSSRGWGYVPTAAVVALMLATPMPWKRRWIALLIALALVHLFIALRVGLMIFYSFHHASLIDLSPFWSKVTGLTCEALSASAVASILIPALIWLLIGFRAGQWAYDKPQTKSASRARDQEASN